MIEHKEKVHLTKEQETLLITLYSKTAGCPKTILNDETSWKVLQGVNYDFSQLNIPKGNLLTVCLRAKKFDDYAREFMKTHLSRQYSSRGRDD